MWSRSYQQNPWFCDSLRIHRELTGLHQTFKWLHLTVALHSYLVYMSFDGLKH